MTLSSQIKRLSPPSEIRTLSISVFPFQFVKEDIILKCDKCELSYSFGLNKLSSDSTASASQ